MLLRAPEELILSSLWQVGSGPDLVNLIQSQDESWLSCNFSCPSFLLVSDVSRMGSDLSLHHGFVIRAWLLFSNPFPSFSWCRAA